MNNDFLNKPYQNKKKYSIMLETASKIYKYYPDHQATIKEVILLIAVCKKIGLRGNHGNQMNRKNFIDVILDLNRILFLYGTDYDEVAKRLLDQTNLLELSPVLFDVVERNSASKFLVDNGLTTLQKCGEDIVNNDARAFKSINNVGPVKISLYSKIIREIFIIENRKESVSNAQSKLEPTYEYYDNLPSSDKEIRKK